MQLRPGMSVIPFVLPLYNGEPWDLSSLKGQPYLLSFFRFAACPFCNLRLHYLVEQFEQLPENFTIVAIFESSLAEVQRYAGRHQSPFPILADDGGVWHDRYSVQQSWWGTIKGMIGRFPTLMKAMLVDGYWPRSIGGKMNTMPADFLVDYGGVIREVHYGKDEGDHLGFEKIKAFAWEQHRLHSMN